ncbi:MAG: aminoacyl-tRNA hydrolase [Candidatus Gastranaerophilales bacterium]|nr:aminoacyl-tRNA hydrolase [Candidatus Gastranaerophilales bacterium]
MKLVAGLGNIGEKYCFTRHNAGFMVVDKIAMNHDVSFKEDKKLKCFIGKFKQNGEDIILIKPTTFMNLSGDSVQLVMNYYKIDISDLLVVYDDLSLEVGKIRFRPNGSDGGHNGIKSVIKSLSNSNIARLKIGIGPQPPIPSEAFVLQNFTKEQLENLKPALKKSVEAVEYYFENGMQKTQNFYN